MLGKHCASLAIVTLAMTLATAVVKADDVAPQQTFASPHGAVSALIDAVRDKDRAALYSVIGYEMVGVFSTGDANQDAQNRDLFLRASTRVRIAPDRKHPGRMIVYLGKAEWPFPEPLVQTEGSWKFDGAIGVKEVRYRRMAANEITVIDACRGYVDAQKDYRSRPGMGHYASRILSTEGKKDGLYWNDDSGQDMSPLGSFFVANPQDATAPPKSYSGYRFRILDAQGQHAGGGTMNYMRDGNLVRGFGLIAWPVEYGKTGLSTFIVNQSGHVYEKDLGADTSSIVQNIVKYNPDSTWERVPTWD